MDGEEPEGFSGFILLLDEAARSIGSSPTYPVFLRTGYGSGKHQWRDTCYVASPGRLARHVVNLVEWSVLVDFIGLPTQTWVVREFLQLRSHFKAYNDMPVAREFRVFIRNGDVECIHPYWPEEAVRNGNPHIYGDGSLEEGRWLPILKGMSLISPLEEMILRGLGQSVGGIFKEWWSVDMAETNDARWLVTDMAIGEESFHWPDCRYALSR